MSVEVTGTLVPAGTSTFPVVREVDVQGTFYTVADKTERNAILNDHRKNGMPVRTRSPSMVWVLKNSPWNGDDSDWAPYVPNGVYLSGASVGGAPVTLVDINGAELVPDSGFTYSVRATGVLSTTAARAYFIRELLVHTQGGATIVHDELVLNRPLGTGWSFTASISGGTLRFTALGSIGLTVNAAARVEVTPVSTAGSS